MDNKKRKAGSPASPLYVDTPTPSVVTRSQKSMKFDDSELSSSCSTIEWQSEAKLSRKGKMDVQKISERELQHSGDSDDITYKVYIKIGDRLMAGTDANVFLTLHGDGNQTIQTKLDLKFHDDFERGHEHKYTIPKTKLSRVESVDIWRDSTGIGDDLLIDTIFVENGKTGEKLPFPVFRRIEAKCHHKFIPDDTSLPQHDTRHKQRQTELYQKQLDYQYEAKAPGYPVQIKSLPRDEEFSFGYSFDINWSAIKLTFSKELDKLLTSEWKCVKDIESLYKIKSFKRPTELDRWCDDVKFGAQRIAGVNNTEIRLCTDIPEKLGVTAAMVEPFLEGNFLTAALQNKKIFIIDYTILIDCPTAKGVVSCEPIALFYERKDGHLVPIAIQLYQDKAKDNPVFLPSDPKYTWIMAKMWFNNADTAVHQAKSHLGFTHMIMEGVAISVNRNLSLFHPIYKLLAPHFLYLIAINSLAVKTLLSPKGYIDQTMTVAVKGTMEILKRAKNDWRMDVDGTLPADLKRRGVDDTNLLPNYHCRDDALLLYDAIKRYVSNYVNVYYVSENDLIEDYELQSWRTEMEKPETDNGLGLKGIPGENDKFTTREQLVIVLTSIIYTCSVGHAQANFKQYDEYGFPPNYPSKLYGTPPKDKSPKTEMDIVNAILSKDDALSLMIVTTILSKRGTNALGNFEVNYLYDPKAVEVADNFRVDLKKIGDIIAARNKEREIPFTILDPKEVPNAISI